MWDYSSFITNTIGDKATFSIVATGTNLLYQWQKNEIDIPNSQKEILQTLPVTEADNGSKYRCRVTNGSGTDVSNEAILTVISSDTNTKPQITQQPSHREVTEGSTAAFKLEAIGKNLTYQWKSNGNNITGATNSEYTIVSRTKLR